MKKLTIAALLVATVSLLCSCGQAPQPKTLHMTASNISAEQGGLSVVYQIINPTDSVVEYGVHYKIDRLYGDDWVPMPVSDETMFIEIIYSLQPGDTSQLYSVELYPERFAYPAGEYRIRKDMYIGGEQKTLTAPFTLEGERSLQPSVKFEVTPDVYDGVPEKITYAVTNETSRKIEFGTYFKMDRLVDSQWHEMPLSDITFFNDLAISPPQGKPYQDDIYMYGDKIEYPAGIYRLRKQVKVNNEERTIYATFRIR